MARQKKPATRTCDALVAGAGLAGLTAGVAFARAGLDVIVCGAAERALPGRTVAMLGRSVEYLRALDVWPAIAPSAAPMRALRLVDDTGGLFPPRPVEFRSSEIGLEEFGWNVENDRMADALAATAATLARLERVATSVSSYEFGPERATAHLAEGGGRIDAALVVGADGRNSFARRAAGLPVRVSRYPQSALTALLSHRRPHDDFSTEFHTRAGPFTLVPLLPSPEAANRSSLVWLMTNAEAERRRALPPEDLAREIERQARSLLGAMRLEGRVGIVPMARQIVPDIVSARLALIGDAAHAFPPIGAQGLNLGLRDVEALAAAAAGARSEGRDIGGAETLAAYQRARRTDIVSRTAAVDLLNRSLLTDFAALDFVRGFGLAALGAIGPLRRVVMREGIAPGQ